MGLDSHRYFRKHHCHQDPEHFRYLPQLLVLSYYHSYLLPAHSQSPFWTYNSALLYFMPCDDFPSLRKLDPNSLPCSPNALCVLNLHTSHQSGLIIYFLLAKLASFVFTKLVNSHLKSFTVSSVWNLLPSNIIISLVFF